MGYTGNYVQCKVQRNVPGGGTRQHVAWIPEKFARLDKIMRIKNDLDEWEDGWRVIETWGTRTAADVERHERDWARQRLASDI